MEAKFPLAFLRRAQALVDPIRRSNCDLICLQEYWFNSEFEDVFEQALSPTHYIHKLKRPGTKEDGLAVFASKDRFTIEQIQDVSITKAGDRVAIILQLGLKEVAGTPPFVLVNSHMTFPHSDFNRYLRFNQITTILDNLQALRATSSQLAEAPMILCGDFNDSQDPVHHEILQNGFQSVFYQLHGRDAQVTHCNHNNDNVGVDFIFHANSLTPRDGAIELISRECGLLPTELSDQEDMFRPSFSIPDTPVQELDTEFVFAPVSRIPVEEKLEAWAQFSDHRPLYASFDVQVRES